MSNSLWLDMGPNDSGVMALKKINYGVWIALLGLCLPGCKLDSQKSAGPDSGRLSGGNAGGASTQEPGGQAPPSGPGSSGPGPLPPSQSPPPAAGETCSYNPSDNFISKYEKCARFLASGDFGSGHDDESRAKAIAKVVCEGRAFVNEYIYTPILSGHGEVDVEEYIADQAAYDDCTNPNFQPRCFNPARVSKVLAAKVLPDVTLAQIQEWAHGLQMSFLERYVNAQILPPASNPPLGSTLRLPIAIFNRGKATFDWMSGFSPDELQASGFLASRSQTGCDEEHTTWAEGCMQVVNQHGGEGTQPYPTFLDSCDPDKYP